MDAILINRRESFFNNLILLGLDRIVYEKKYGIKFHRDMFALPNKKGYEVVTYFLFLKLSSATGKDYNIPWPLLDKEYDRGFQKTCYNHLMNFSEENLVNFPRIVPSVITTFGGDRFYEVYFAFSCYVLSKTIRKSGNINLLSRPVITQENFVEAKRSLQLSTILCVQRFKDTEILTHDSHLIWTTFSKNLQECLQKLKKLLESNEDLLKKKQEIISSLYSVAPGEIFNLKKLIERSFECWKPEIKQRKKLEKFFTDEKTFWNYLASEVGENIENEFLNGLDYNFCIDNLPEECHKKLEKVGFSSSLEAGKLSVLRFMKLFMAYLVYITELLEKNLNELQGTPFVEDAASIQDDLSSVENLNKKLSEEIIPVIEESIKKLKLIHRFDDPKEDSEICASLPVLSFHPEVVKERSSHFNTDLLFEEKGPCCEKSFDSVFMSEKEPCSEKSFDSVFMSEKMSLSDLSSLNRDILNSDSSTSFATDVTKTASSVQLFGVADAEGISSSEVMHSAKAASSKDLHSTFPKLGISALDDIDCDPSFQFKMRKSWLNEDLLSAMTLPDISFDEGNEDGNC